MTHLFADALLHPMIFHLTGPYDHPSFREGTVARQDHRRLETLLDMHFAGGYERVKRCSLATVLGEAEAPLDEIFTNAGTARLEPGRAPGFAEGLASAFRLFAFMQGLFRNPVLGRLSFRLFPIVPSFAREVLALVYAPQLARYEAQISGDIRYRHPCSGIEETGRLDDLFRRAVELSVAFCRGLEPLLDGEKRPARLICRHVGPRPGVRSGPPAVPLCGEAVLRMTRAPGFSFAKEGLRDYLVGTVPGGRDSASCGHPLDLCGTR